MNRLAREPLVHFLLLGALLFGAYSALNRKDAASPEDIVVTNARIETLAAGFAKVWQRPPTEAELKTLIDGYVKEEILSREAKKLGLDQDDTVIRRRLQQKMEFIGQDLAMSGEPTEAELSEFLAAHPDLFAMEQRFDFRQVFLNPERRGDRLDADAAALLESLRRDPAADLAEVGDPLLLPQEFADEPRRSVEAQFGVEFAAALARSDTGGWSGPIRSSYGAHLVEIRRRTEGRLPALDEVRERVKQELLNARRVETNQKFLDALLARYHVTIRRDPATANSR
ncbi:MAG TPA: peptidylprolyl isomerase [Planctomycetota bacterium]|jgi:hypothetical protein|nr:peptidylprolyl isomerase [Planctomycetota bacterium]